MKKIVISILLLITVRAHAQDKFSGEYKNYFGSRIQLNPDSTFNYKWRSHMSGSWTNGTWRSSNDTIYFEAVLVYDTVKSNEDSDITIDSFILSSDEHPESLTPEEYAVSLLTTVGQNRQPVPNKLYYHNKRLFGIENDGKLIKKKIRSVWNNKKYVPWYIKQ